MPLHFALLMSEHMQPVKKITARVCSRTELIKVLGAFDDEL